MDARAKSKSDTQHSFTCPFCGGEHRRKSREARECRALSRKGKQPKPVAVSKEAGERRAGTPTTHYQPKPERWALAAKKLQKGGMTTGRIAKRLGVNANDVERVLGGT